MSYGRLLLAGQGGRRIRRANLASGHRGGRYGVEERLATRAILNFATHFATRAAIVTAGAIAIGAWKFAHDVRPRRVDTDLRTARCDTM